MEEFNPFIKLLSTPYGKYFYDVNRNEIVPVPEKTYNALQIIKGKRIGELDSEDIEAIDKIKSKGYLSDKHPSEIKHPMLEYADDLLKRKIPMIILQVTQSCNLRCSYCIYSDIDNDLQRSHSAKHMTFETAKKAVDFLWEHSVDSPSVNIGFYGGEPLLEIELIKKVIEYAEELFAGKRLTFSITTNGTLLSEDIIEYFNEKKMQLTISLDGPEEIHDKYRRFAADGKGTFRVIFDNVEKLRKKYPEYFSKALFNMVINPQNDFAYTNSIFKDYDYLKSGNVSPSIVDDSYSMEKTTYSDEFNEHMNYHIFLALLSALERLDQEKVSPIALQNINQVIIKKKDLGKQMTLGDCTAPGGPCVPGQVRLFVSVNGNFYPCERVSESSEVMNIGNINDGFDMKNVKALLNVGSITAEECKNCWAFTNCFLCAKYADDGNCLNPELRKSYCKEVRQTVREQFLDMIALDEVTEERRKICE